MKQKSLWMLAALSLLLIILTSILAFSYFERNSAPYALMSIAALLFGGGLVACINKLTNKAA
ncbi:hypothetical protein LJC27_08080 [Christensenellaceae bacterium OttesenSCG-928-M15]|nr:hypothetical protein [Christensenellaceae bacterium OttesenSCG-928-M15]